jgi:hypothetical protein
LSASSKTTAAMISPSERLIVPKEDGLVSGRLADYQLTEKVVGRLRALGWGAPNPQTPSRAIAYRCVGCPLRQEQPSLKERNVSAAGVVNCTQLERSSTTHVVASLTPKAVEGTDRSPLLINPHEVPPPSGEIGRSRIYYEVAPLAQVALSGMPPLSICRYRP